MPQHLDSINKGLYLENLNILVPWKTSVDNIVEYGQPEIILQSDQRIDAIWKNVKIFGGLSLDLNAMFWQTFFGRNKFNNAHAYIDKETFDNFKTHLDSYFGQEGMLIKQNGLEYYFKWAINNCKIKLGQGDRFGSFYYIKVDRKNWL